MINIAVMGYGTVGSGVVEVIDTNGERIAQRIGDALNVKYVLDIRDFPEDPIQEKIIHDFETIISDDEIQIVVEVMGGIEPAYTFVKRSLLAGKCVVTSNKALVAKHGAELLSIAKEKNINFLFEASVGGGIPIIRPLNSSLTADEIEEITGILNGTTNYMLTKMFYEGADYASVLKEAQDNGYAERNPEADVEGYDACRKIAILSSLAFGKYVDYEDVYTEGITKITSADFAYAKILGSRIKLFGTSKKKEDGSISAMVCPVMITNEHPLFAVNDVMNAILVRGESMGDLMFYGAGAGKLPTASAVVADVVNAARNPKITEIEPYEPGKMTVSDHLKSTHSYFVRVKGSDANAVAESFKAKQIVDAGIADEFGLVTAEWAENEFDALCENYPVVSVIRLAK
jgi:homoserine dehydrogenase